MKNEIKAVTKLTTQSDDDEILRLEEEDLEVPDLSGEHEAVITYFEKKKSKNGNTYFSVGARIASGSNAGETVFGRLFPGGSLCSLLELVGCESTEPKDLRKKDIIGKPVMIRVEESEMEGVGGSAVFDIVSFFGQSVSDELAM